MNMEMMGQMKENEYEIETETESFKKRKSTKK